jgi:hypothetical protein
VERDEFDRSQCAQAANVLINSDGRVVLSDFGVTANLERVVPSPRASMSPRASASSPCSPGSLGSMLGSLPEDAPHCCASAGSGSLASFGAARSGSLGAMSGVGEPPPQPPQPAASPCAAVEVQQQVCALRAAHST